MIYQHDIEELRSLAVKAVKAAPFQGVGVEISLEGEGDTQDLVIDVTYTVHDHDTMSRLLASDSFTVRGVQHLSPALVYAMMLGLAMGAGSAIGAFGELIARVATDDAFDEVEGGRILLQ